MFCGMNSGGAAGGGAIGGGPYVINPVSFSGAMGVVHPGSGPGPAAIDPTSAGAAGAGAGAGAEASSANGYPAAAGMHAGGYGAYAAAYDPSANTAAAYAAAAGEAGAVAAYDPASSAMYGTNYSNGAGAPPASAAAHGGTGAGGTLDFSDDPNDLCPTAAESRASVSPTSYPPRHLPLHPTPPPSPHPPRLRREHESTLLLHPRHGRRGCCVGRQERLGRGRSRSSGRGSGCEWWRRPQRRCWCWCRRPCRRGAVPTPWGEQKATGVGRAWPGHPGGGARCSFLHAPG